MEENQKFFLHSRCCNGHWKLIYQYDNLYELQCPKCGTPTGQIIVISNAKLEETTPCCGAYWEIVYNPKTKTYSIECEDCECPAENIKVHGPSMDGTDCQCEYCQRPPIIN